MTNVNNISKMDYASCAIKVMILLMELVRLNKVPIRNHLIMDAEHGIGIIKYVFHAQRDGPSITKENVLQ